MDKTLFDSMIRDIYQNRKPDGIKSDFGKVLIIGGSKPYPLSVCIADKFASLSGVGYVSLAVDKSIYQIVASRVSLTSIFEISTRDEGIDLSNDTLRKYDSILFGNGIFINLIINKIYYTGFAIPFAAFKLNFYFYIFKFKWF